MARKLTLAKASGQALVKITCPSQQVATLLAEALVEGKAAACVNIVPEVTSVYRWQGRLCREPEVLLIVKTHLDRAERLLGIVEEHHPYEVPEVLWIEVNQGSQSYLEWLDESCR